MKVTFPDLSEFIGRFLEVVIGKELKRIFDVNTRTQVKLMYQEEVLTETFP